MQEIRINSSDIENENENYNYNKKSLDKSFQNISNFVNSNDMNEQKDVLDYYKIMMIIIQLIFCGPFIICNLYYAYTDTSCVHKNNDNLQVNLFTYLVVDGLLSGIVLLMIIIYIIFMNIEKVNNKDNYLLSLLERLFKIFTFAWTIVGAIIFWGNDNSNSCDQSVYNYIFTILIIKLITISSFLK